MPKSLLKGKLKVFYQVWPKNPNERYWVHDKKGKRQFFDRIAKAREWAYSQGYEGITLVPAS